VQIELSSDEFAFLAELLRRDYQELREEIYKTEDTRFKANLHAKERLIEVLLKRLEAGPVAGRPKNSAA
jgi:hypothetical protein